MAGLSWSTTEGLWELGELAQRHEGAAIEAQLTRRHHSRMMYRN
jgi:hypothetical protein